MHFIKDKRGFPLTNWALFHDHNEILNINIKKKTYESSTEWINLIEIQDPNITIKIETEKLKIFYFKIF